MLLPIKKMEREQFNREFLNRDMTLKLYRDIPQFDFSTKIGLIKSYTDQIKNSYDSEVFEVRLNNEIGFVYWNAKEYALAIKHFEKVISILKPDDYPFLYFNVVCLLIRSNRLISNYGASLLWVEKAIDNISYSESSFVKLDILNEYVDLILESNQSFNDDFTPIIQFIIDDLGFPEKLRDPKETAKSMKKTNGLWNQKLSKVTLMDKNDKQARIKEFEKYYEACEISWYKNYANDKINKLKEDK